jgi:hypothetical protein
VDVLAVLDDAPSVTVRGVTVPHNTREWRVATNRHPCTGGAAWGWIEGAPGNVCWSNEKNFNREAAGQMVAAHSQWLEDQKPLSIRLVEARERYMRAKATHDNALAAYSKARACMVEAKESFAALANIGGAS